MLHRSATALLSLLFLAGFLKPAHSDDFTWTGLVASDDWDAQITIAPPDVIINNWTPGTGQVPDADDTVLFGVSAGFVVDLNGDRSVQSAAFADSNGYTLNNNTLTLLTGNLTATGDATHTINSGLTLDANGTFDIGPDASIDLNGVLTSGSNLTQRGGGTLTLTASGNTLNRLDIGTTGDGPEASDFVLDGASLELSSLLRLADDGRARLSILNGGSLSSSGGEIADESASLAGEVLVTGTDALGNASSWTMTGDLIFDGDEATMVVSAGGHVSNRFGTIEEGVVTVTGTDANGNASTWTNESELGIGRFGGSLIVEAGGRVTAPRSDIAFLSDYRGAATVRGSDAAGNASTLAVSGSLQVANFARATATLDILDGGLVSSGQAEVGVAFGDTRGDVLVSGADGFGNQATWVINGDLELGFTDAFDPVDDGEGTLEVRGGGVVSVAGITTVNRGGQVRLRGGTFDFGQTTLDEYQRFDATSGTLAGLVETTQTYDVPGLLAELVVNNVDTAGVGVINNGRVFGPGTIAIDFTNGPSGEIEVINGERMLFTGPANASRGQVTLAGGQVEYAQGFTNAAGGLVLGNGSLRSDAGITNFGTMAFSSSDTVLAHIIGDVTNESNGLITNSGGSATFFDDVVNNGEIRTNAGSTTVYFGSYSGNGDTGVGTVIMEGDLKPGFSPGLMAFGGDLSFGDSATTEIEIGGPTPGADYDQISVADQLTLDGMLNVSLFGGFTPVAGELFSILTAAGGVTGVFDSETLPTLGGGLGWDVLYSPTAVELLVVPLNGDFDADGDVDVADALLGQRWGASLDGWAANFGTAGGPLVGAAAVPEPTCAALLLIGLLVFSRRR